MNKKQKYLAFLEVILDATDFKKNNVALIPISDFINEGLDRNDIPQYFEKSLDDCVIAKREILYFSKDVTLSLKIEFSNKLTKSYTVPWYKVELMVKRQDLLIYINKTKNEESYNLAGRPTFDSNAGEISWGIKQCKVPLNKNQYYFAKSLFDVPIGKRVEAGAILNQQGWRMDSEKSVYDAMYLLNKKTLKVFGIKLFARETQHYFINDGKA